MHKLSVLTAFAVSSLLLAGPALAAEELKGEGPASRLSTG